MHIYVNDIEAVVPEDLEIQYVSENRYFTDADDYSFEITFPLKDCLQNKRIFGHIIRLDNTEYVKTYRCEIRDLNLSISGALTIVEVSDVEVKCQLLCKRSLSNFEATFDETYINTLMLGVPADGRKYSDDYRQYSDEDFRHNDYVPYPWVAVIGGDKTEQNWMGNNQVYWARSSIRHKLSFQPYLLFITKRIFEVLDYSYDLSAWESSPYKGLLICNSLPAEWGIERWQALLPHWTVSEFIQQIEYLLGGFFDIDHFSKTISFRFFDRLSDLPETQITNVINEFQIGVVSEEEVKNVIANNYKYADCSHDLWKYYSCPWLIRDGANEYGVYFTPFDTFEGMKSYLSAYRRIYRQPLEDSYYPLNNIYYARDISTYFMLRVENEGVEDEREYKDTVLVPLNQFGPRLNEENSAIDLKMVPACLDVAEESRPWLGLCIHIPINSDYVSDHEFERVPVEELIDSGETATDDNVYFDKIYVAWTDGVPHMTNPHIPCPFVDSFHLAPDWETYENPVVPRSFNPLRLNLRSPYFDIEMSNYARKYNIEFLSDTIPNVRSIFFIKGCRYVCESITTSITGKGLSKRMKGVFYRVDS